MVLPSDGERNPGPCVPCSDILARLYISTSPWIIFVGLAFLIAGSLSVVVLFKIVVIVPGE